MRKTYYTFYLPAILLFGISVIYFFNFIAEDAYITYRYAENLVNIGSLVFNDGETINALTSPFHALLSSALFYITGNTVLSNKILALFLLLISFLLIWRRFNNHPELQLLVPSLILLPSCVSLWTFGGLETPLLLFLTTAMVLLINSDYSKLVVPEKASFSGTTKLSFKLLCLAFVLAGLGFLTRYDSVLFFAPVTLYAASRGRSLKHVLGALIIGALLPILWITISITYYGDVFPTSFYVKTPGVDVFKLLSNGKYIFFYLLFTGVIPVLLLFFFFLPVSIDRKFKVLNQNIKTMWWLYLGILLELFYGLTMATTHMMFSFRFFVPYLPSTAIIILDLIGNTIKTTKEINLYSARFATIFKSFLICLLLFQGFQIYYTYNHSVNGISLIGEYRKLSVRDYIKFIEILCKESEDIKAHWYNIKEGNNRHPRIYTFAAGILPYVFQDSYVYERLVSYRHNSSGIPYSFSFTAKDQYSLKLSSDYIHILAPRHGAVHDQLPKPIENYMLVSSYALYFDGSKQTFFVYYNQKPEPNKLKKSIGFH